MENVNVNNENWNGWLVRIKDGWLNPGEVAEPYVVLEDRGNRVLIQQLPEYKPEFRTFLQTEEVFKDWCLVVDKEIQKR